MGTRIEYEDPDRNAATAWKIAGAALLGAAAAIGLGIYLARDQMERHRRDLFSPHPLRRLAALGYLKSHPSGDDLPLLRDYLAWEERPLLRKRAAAILMGLEGGVGGGSRVGEGPGGGVEGAVSAAKAWASIDTDPDDESGSQH